MKTVLQYLETSALNYPDRPAVSDGESCLTYSQLEEKSKRIGSFLCGITDIDKPIIIFARKSTQALCCFFGAAYAAVFILLQSLICPVNGLKRCRACSAQG